MDMKDVGFAHNLSQEHLQRIKELEQYLSNACDSPVMLLAYEHRNERDRDSRS